MIKYHQYKEYIVSWKIINEIADIETSLIKHTHKFVLIQL